MSMVRLTVHAAGVFGARAILIDGIPAVILGEELLYFPVILFGAHAELEVFSGDGVPVL